MLKQYVAVLLMSISAILMVGHDIIPHHHDESKDHHHHVARHHSDAHAHDSHASQHHSDSNDTSDENGGLNDLLSYFVHTGDFVFQDTSVKQTVDIENERFDNSLVEFKEAISFCTIIVSKSIGYNYIGPDYIPPHSNSKGLRAPPVFFS